jgi:hypothetical protein
LKTSSKVNNVSSNIGEWITSSFFGNRYVTPIEIEIKDNISKNRTYPKQRLVDNLCKQGYNNGDVTKELNRQCSCSTLRFIPSEDVYVSVEIGMSIWSDICSRIHTQESMVGGKLQVTESGIKVDIYRTDFQFSKLTERVASLGFKQAPVMRWTGTFSRKKALKCLDQISGGVPFAEPHEKGDRLCVLDMVCEVIERKPKRAPWAWLLSHAVVKVEMTPVRRDVIETLFLLSNGPVDWKGNLISLHELKMNTNLSLDEIEKAVEYFQEKGVVRQVRGDFSPTDQGYTLVRRAFRDERGVTFALVHVTEADYKLEISTPSYIDPEIMGLLNEEGGTSVSEVGTPVVFCPYTREEVVDLLGMLVDILEAREP